MNIKICYSIALLIFVTISFGLVFFEPSKLQSTYSMDIWQNAVNKLKALYYSRTGPIYNSTRYMPQKLFEELKFGLAEARSRILTDLTKTNETVYASYFKSHETLNAKFDKDYWAKVNAIKSIATVSASCTMDWKETATTGISHCGIFYKGIYYKWGVTKSQCPIRHQFTPRDCYEHVGTSMVFIEEKNFQNFDQHSKVMMPSLFVHVIPHGLINALGYVLMDGYFIMPIGCTTKKQEPTTVPKQHYKEVFVISQYWGAGFYHANVEDIPRLAGYLTFLREFKHIKIHTSSRNTFISNALNVLGIGPGRIVTGVMSTDIVYLPQGGGCGDIHQPSGLFLSMYYHQYIEEVLLNSSKSEQSYNINSTKVTTSLSPSSRHNPYLEASLLEPYNFPRDRNVILIKRSNKRWLAQHDHISNKISELAETLGFKFMVYDDKNLPTSADTMVMFYHAALIVAPHGAGLSNILYSKPGIYILEILCKNDPNFCYKKLAQKHGMHYFGFSSHHGCGAMLVDVKALLEIVNLFLKKILEGL